MKLERLSILGQDRAKAAGKLTPAINPATSGAQPRLFWTPTADVDVGKIGIH